MFSSLRRENPFRNPNFRDKDHPDRVLLPWIHVLGDDSFVILSCDSMNIGNDLAGLVMRAGFLGEERRHSLLT